MAVTTIRAKQSVAPEKIQPGKVEKSVKALRKNGVFIGEPANHEDTVAVAAFKQMRTLVLNELKALDVHTVLVTGPTQGVGKTAMSINLAYSISKLQNCKAVLIDLDLRGSSMQSKLGINSEYGSERIGDHDFSFVRASYYLGNDNLLVLPASHRLSDSSEILMSDITKKNLDLMSKTQDSCYVIYDAPPVLGCDDVAALIPSMDAAIMVVEEGVTSRSELSESMRILDELPVIATILNKSNDKKIQQYYY